MKITISTIALITALSQAAATQAEVSFDWAVIGNPGNEADSETGLGAVDYTYRISKFEVTNSQFVEFLNAVAADDTYGIGEFMPDFPTPGVYQPGIVRSGTPGEYVYSVRPDETTPQGKLYTYSDKPVTFVSFLHAVRFVNWLENGQPVASQGPATTEEGTYLVSDGFSETRGAGSLFFLPTEHEWYKAAYFDPATQNYYDYPNGSDIRPDNNPPANDSGDSANYDYANGRAQYLLTDVGAYQKSHSPYGTFDQGGNAWEWNETLFPDGSPVADGSQFGRGLRGGGANHFASRLKSDYSGSWIPSDVFFTSGFRVASRIPEPSALLLGLVGLALLLRTKRTAR